MVFKKSVRQEISIKSLDINNLEVGSDGKLYSKPTELSNNVIDMLKSEDEQVRNAFVFLDKEMTNAETLTVKTDEVKKRGRRKKENLS